MSNGNLTRISQRRSPIGAKSSKSTTASARDDIKPNALMSPTADDGLAIKARYGFSLDARAPGPDLTHHVTHRVADWTPQRTQSYRIHAFGGPDVISLDDTNLPALHDLHPGEAIIRIDAASMNRVDGKQRRGEYRPASRATPPFSLGRDLAGVVVAINGAGCRLAVGDRVFAMLHLDRGSHARHVVAKVGEVAQCPSSLSAVEAAALPFAALTAWQGLFDQGRLRPGQTVLIHGAMGGVGHLAVQLAKLHGARVVATVAPDAMAQVQALGADIAIDYRSQHFEQLCGQVDLVLDLVGGETQQRSWDVIRERGALISTVSEPSEQEAERRHIRALRYVVHPSIAQLDAVRELVDQGRLNVIVEHVFGFGQAVQAHRWLDRGHARGKLVLDMNA